MSENHCQCRAGDQFCAPLKQLSEQKNFSLQLNAMVRCARKSATPLV
jgi:hypothetical protein